MQVFTVKFYCCRMKRETSHSVSEEILSSSLFHGSEKLKEKVVKVLQ